MNLEHKVAIVTGATSGIGFATTKRLLDHGAKVLAVGRKLESLKALGHFEDALRPLAMDVTSEQGPKAIVKAALEAWGKIDILVNAAGIIASGTIENTDDQAWDKMMDLNVRAPFRLMREAMPYLIDSKGAVVNVSSVTGLRSFPGILSYSVSKAAVDHLTRCAALEMAPKGVRINAVNPGVVVTQLHRRAGMDEEQYAQFLEHSKSTHPIGRAGRPEEVALWILMLVSGENQWLTGETIAIDGGRHLTCAR